MFVILDYLVQYQTVSNRKSQKILLAENFSWPGTLTWYSWHVHVMERTQNHNDYANLELSGGARQLPWTITVPCTFPCISTQTQHFSFCPMPLPRNLSASFWSKAGDTSFESLHFSWHQDPWLRCWAVPQSGPVADAHSVPSVLLST